MTRKKFFHSLMLVFIASSLLACSTAEEKSEKFLNKGKMLAQQGDFVKAALEFRNAITVTPDKAEAYFLAGQAEFKKRNLQEAYSFFMKAVEKQPDHTAANIEIGKLLLSAHEYAKAHERAQMVLSKEPENKQAFMLEGAAFLGERKFQAAKITLESLLQKGSQDMDLFLLLAVVYSRSGDQDSAETILNKGIGVYPSSIPLLVTLANTYLEQKHTEKIEPLLRRIIELEPDKAEHVERLATFFWHENRKPEAEELIDSLLTKKNDEDQYNTVATFYYSRKELEKCQQVLLKGLKQHPQSFQLRFLLKDSYLAGGDFAKAMAMQQESLALDQQNPAYITAQKGMAELLLQAGNIEEADTFVTTILKRSANDIDAHLLLGSISMLKGDFDKAVAEFRTVLQARPKDIKLYQKLADALVKNRQNNLAIDVLKQGLQITPDAPDLHLALAKVYTIEKQIKNAESQLNKLVELNPNDQQAKIYLADFFTAQGEYDKAKKLYKTVLVKVPADALASIKLSSLEVALKQEAEAIATVVSGITANPENNALLEHGIRLLLQYGRTGEALAIIEQRLRKQPNDFFAYSLQGRVYEDKKNFTAAEQAYRKAMAMDPTVLDIPIRLARVLVATGQGQQAISASALLLQGPAPSLSQYILLAELYKQMEKNDLVAVIHEQAMNKYPNNWFTLNNYAYYLANKQETNEQELTKAEESAKKALQIAPGNVAVLDTLGWIYFKEGKIAPAKATLTLALSIQPNNLIFTHHLAMVLLKGGDKEEAKQLFQKVAGSNIGASTEREEAEKMLKSMTL